MPTLKIEPLDCVIVFRANGEHEVLLPDLADDQEAPPNVDMVAMLALAMQDHAIMSVLAARLDALYEAEAELEEVSPIPPKTEYKN